MTRIVSMRYNSLVGALMAWSTALALILVWMWAVFWVYDQAAQSACQSTSEAIGHSDSCQP